MIELWFIQYMPIIVQHDATIYSLFISVHRSTYFGWYLQPSSGAHVTVSTASGTCREREVPVQSRSQQLPDAVDKVT